MNFQSEEEEEEEEEEEQRRETKSCPNSGLGSWTCQDLKHLATSIAETRVVSLRCSHLFNVSNTPSSNPVNSLSVSNSLPIFNLSLSQIHSYITPFGFAGVSVYNKKAVAYFARQRQRQRQRAVSKYFYYPKLDQCVNVVGGNESDNN